MYIRDDEQKMIYILLFFICQLFEMVDLLSSCATIYFYVIKLGMVYSSFIKCVFNDLTKHKYFPRDNKLPTRKAFKRIQFEQHLFRCALSTFDYILQKKKNYKFSKKKIIHLFISIYITFIITFLILKYN